MRLSLRDIPQRVSTGAFILHSGLEKRRADEERATAIHAMAVNAFPFLADVSPTTFVKGLALAEIGVGAALLTPFVPDKLAGASLTAFATAMLALYLRTPALHKPGSVWPSHEGIGVSKDVWMLGIGLGMATERAAA
jgi:uncharacterized membrane protein YkgB